ncbi:hypothetical protein AALO_G00227460 [Alosa alosa]|uniref:C-type lectin domain-containing protein n=1 Tax=Alosa alosa TaxID=278164 RepID=A0AAV6G3D9_9TELE|nr:hypothetical protein AALO_G00227460 [Alosa alosa]
MDHLLLITLLFSGLCSVSSRVVRRYHFVNEKKTWEEAQEYCRCNFTDLATVEDTDDMTAMTSTVKDGYAKEVWIGLNKTTNSTWRWSVQGSRAYSVEETNFTSWGSGEPNDIYGNEDCTLFNKGRWNDASCKFKNFFICYNECPYDLFLIRENKTWREALDYCNRKNMELVSASSSETQGCVKEVTRGASTAHVWMGLSFLCPMELWIWISGVMLCSDDWAHGNGTGRSECGLAGALQSGGQRKWVSRPMNEKLNFICSSL